MKLLLMLLLINIQFVCVGCHKAMVTNQDQFLKAIVSYGQIDYQNVQVICVVYKEAGYIHKVLLYNRENGLYKGRFERKKNSWYWFPNYGLYTIVRNGTKVHVDVVNKFVRWDVQNE